MVEITKRKSTGAEVACDAQIPKACGGSLSPQLYAERYSGGSAKNPCDVFGLTTWSSAHGLNR